MEEETVFLQNYFMGEALKEAKEAFRKDEVPIGVLIVKDQKIVARAHNQVEALKDPTAHAEMLAVTQAARTLKSKWLYDCDVYVTIEPCAMCAGALVLARVKRLFIGALDAKAGGCGSVLEVADNARLNHRVEVFHGLKREVCADQIQQFFKGKREKSA